MPDQSFAFDQHQPPLTVARELAADYVNAHAIFLAGSVIREDATPTSDLDFVIVTSDDEAAPYRKSVVRGGWPVELFVHTSSSLEDFFHSDIRRRRPSLPNMCAEALIVFQQNGRADEIKARAQQLLLQGPAALDESEIELQRYLITDLLMDLEGSNVSQESLFIALRLAEHTADFYLAFHQCWSGQGKWLWRNFNKAFPMMSTSLEKALKTCVQGDKQDLVVWVKRCLKDTGGPCFSGFYRGS